MNSNQNNKKSETGLRDGAISLALGIISMILALACGAWIPMLLASPLLALVGLFFGAMGLKSTGKRKYLAAAGIVMCSLALVVSLYLLFAGGLYCFFTY